MPSLEALLLGTKRSIEPTNLEGQVTGEAIIPDVTIAETHSDEVVVTTHPVDTGAQIADHAYRQPASVICTFGWSDSSRLVNSLFDGSLFKGIESVKDVYDKLLRLKDARQVLKLSTGKRVYDAVIITKLMTTTTVDTENSAIIEVTFQEIITARARTVTLASVTQSNASRTAGTSNGGNRSAQQILLGGAR
jgi:hypothetical protein|nr:MAG TPA: hypothetical protein [Caudoviricetes sp.]